MSKDTPELDELTRKMIVRANDHIDAMLTVFQLKANLTESSIAVMDDTITSLDRSMPLQKAMIVGYGAYVGEVIRRNLGGVWVPSERDMAELEQIGGVGIQASPISWVLQRFDPGSEESLAHRYSVLKQQVATAGGRVSPEPVAMPTGQRYVFSTTVDAADMDVPKDALTGPFAEQLAMAPVIVFYLVAKADGKADGKEFGVLNAILTDPEMCSSPFLRLIIRRITLPKAEEYRFAVSGWFFSPLDELAKIGAILDEHYPDQAHLFKESLIHIAANTANASRGFLGLTRKFGWPEIVVVRKIAEKLGYHDEEEYDEADDSTEMHLKRLRRAPLIVAVVVASADGNFDQKEAQAMRDLLAGADAFSSEVMRIVTRKHPESFTEEIIQEICAEGFDAMAELERVGAILDASYPLHAEDFKWDLMRIAKRVAEASGSLFSLGKNLSKDEANSLKSIAAALGLPDVGGNDLRPPDKTRVI